MIARHNSFTTDSVSNNRNLNFRYSSLNNKILNPLYLYNSVILDTETTGLKHYDEICEIAVIDAITSMPLLNTLIKPMRTIPEGATKIHGISNAHVANAPSYNDIHKQLMRIFKNKNVIIYNEEFDLRMLQQTAKLYDLLSDEVNQLLMPNSTIICAMKWYAYYYGQWNIRRNNFKWQKLVNAAKQQKLDISNIKAHRALADCQITQQLIHDVNRKILLQQG